MMNFKRIQNIIIVLSIIAFISNWIAIGFSLETYSFDVSLRIIKNFFADEFVHAISALAFLISLIFMHKTKIPFICSTCLIAFAEIFRFAFILSNYKIDVYTLKIIIYNLIEVIVLVVIANLVIMRKAHYDLLIVTGIICALLYTVVCILQGLHYTSYLKISLDLCYLPTYLALSLIGVQIKNTSINMKTGDSSAY